MPDDQTPAGIGHEQMRDALNGGDWVGPDYRQLDHKILGLLHAATLSPDQDDCRRAITLGLARGIGVEAMADQYIPAVAHVLGKQWCEDEKSFAEVTVGSARLQAMLRDLGPAWISDAMAHPSAPVVLVVVDEKCTHTLGAMVMSGILRRRGLSVCIQLGASPSVVKARLQHSRPDAVFISASQSDSLDSLKRIVDLVKASDDTDLPVVLGGGILVPDPEKAKLTGADFVTNDPDEAIALCGLTRELTAFPRPMRGM